MDGHVVHCCNPDHCSTVAVVDVTSRQVDNCVLNQIEAKDAEGYFDNPIMVSSMVDHWFYQ